MDMNTDISMGMNGKRGKTMFRQQSLKSVVLKMGLGIRSIGYRTRLKPMFHTYIVKKVGGAKMKRYIVWYEVNGNAYENQFAFAEDAQLNAQLLAKREDVERVELYRLENITTFK